MEMKVRGYWDVVAGVAVGEPQDQFHRQWLYTQAMYEEDLAQLDKLFNSFPNGVDPNVIIRFGTHYSTLNAEATRYAEALINPAVVKWVQMLWVWS